MKYSDDHFSHVCICYNMGIIIESRNEVMEDDNEAEISESTSQKVRLKLDLYYNRYSLKIKLDPPYMLSVR